MVIPRGRFLYRLRILFNDGQQDACRAGGLFRPCSQLRTQAAEKPNFAANSLWLSIWGATFLWQVRSPRD